MSFLRDDEYIILMNLGTHMLQGSPSLSLDNRKRIRDAGVQTAIEYPEWAEMEPAQGVYDFSVIDRTLEINRLAGMKTIFSIPGPWIPQWIPNDWRPKYADGVYNTSVISMWSEEGRWHEETLFVHLMDKYLSDDVNFILERMDTGESAIASYAWYDDNAIKSFKKFFPDDEIDYENEQTKGWLEGSIISYFVGTQIYFYAQRKEVWNSLQWLISHKNPPSMNWIQPKLIENYKRVYPDAELWLMQYTYFDDSHPAENEVYVDKLKQDFDLDVIVEAMFCKGLPSTAPRAIAKGFRGQIVCPTHPHTGEQHFQGWMVDNIREAHNLWSRSR